MDPIEDRSPSKSQTSHRTVPEAPTTSKPDPLRVLILEDQPDDAELLLRELRQSGFAPRALRLDSETEFISQLNAELDLILSDYSMPQFDALRALELLQQSGLDVPFIVITGSFEHRAIECMKRGAADYLLKDRLGRLGPAVRQALHDQQLRRERIQIEQALRESEARFRNVAESSVDVLILVDERGTIGYVNPAAGRVFGYDDGQLLGQPLEHLLAPPARARLADRLEQALHGEAPVGDSARVEVVGRRKNGSEFPLELALSPWEVGGKQFLSAAMRDLTEAKEALTRALLQDKLAAVGQLAAGIAHDFNNILGTIMLYSELLLRSANLPDKESGQLKTMVQQARRGANLVSQILDFSRRSVVQLYAMDLGSFLGEMVELLSRTLPENIRVTLDLEGARQVVEADPTRLQQVIMNLALNARDAMPQGGELQISLDRTEFTDDAPPPFGNMPNGPWLRLRLRDSGTGIRPEDLSHVFEPFFTTKPPGEGTGLGLAQVYGLVKQHEGYVDVSSQPGVGTTFAIYLPESQRASGDAPDQQTLQGTPGDGETILLVEDDDTTRGAVAEILRSLQYRVIGARSGRQALEIYDADPPAIDLVLSDLVMPDMGGKELYQTLSKRHTRVRVLLMTGYPLGVETKELLDRRELNWLQKPFSSESLAQKVRQMLAWK